MNLLLRVQELDDRLAVLAERQRHDAALLERDPDVERARVAAERATSEQRSAEATLTALEQELQTVSSRARTMHRRLYGGSVRNPQELLEMQRELDTLTGRVQQLENEAITAMEDAERAVEATAARQQELDGAERERAQRQGPLQQRLEAVAQEVATLQVERRETFESVAAADRALYIRVAAHHRPAVVSIAGDACGGCHLPLSIEERRAVRSGERVVQCANCDRILVP